jgi:hypothetical protein
MAPAGATFPLSQIRAGNLRCNGTARQTSIY